MTTTIYHNPRCAKSRATLDLLRERGIEPQIIEYLKTPPDHVTLAWILERLGREPRELMRTQEPEYREAGLDNPGLDRDALIEGMIRHPKVIERPIVVAGERVALGRPPENVLEILS